MKNNLLTNKLSEIQKEYLALLKNLQKKVIEEDFIYIIDELNFFWYSKKRLITLFLETIAPDSSCYAFMDGNYLHLGEKEEFPFITLGKKHIVNDYVFEYLSKTPQKDFKKFQKLIQDSLESNIKIIEDYYSIIYILPLSMFSEEFLDESLEFSDKLFLHIFQDKNMTIEKYYEKHTSFSDIGESLLPHIKNRLIFSDGEPNAPFEDKALFAATKYSFLFQGKTEPEIFFMMTRSLFSKALRIIWFCDFYNLVPYINKDILFFYIHILLPPLESTNTIENKDIFRKCTMARSLSIVFNRNKIKDISLYQYREAVINYNIDSHLENYLKALGRGPFSVREMKGYINGHLNSILKDLQVSI